MKISFNAEEYDNGLEVLRDEEIKALEELNHATNGLVQEFFITLLNPKKQGEQNEL